MNLAEFGLLVKTLRQSNHDEYGKRWTRESFSEKINLTPHQLGRLERGDRKYLDNLTLQLLAESLNLTALEQKELLLAAIGLPDNEIYLFRRSSLRYRHTDYFSFLFRELLNETSFDIDWYSNHRFNYQLDMTYEPISLKHPCHGPMNYIITETAAATSEGNLYLMVNNPSDIATMSAFSEMISEHGNKVRRLSTWPQKQF